MPNVLFAMPVTVEQVAAVIEQMNDDDQEHLLDLTPKLRERARYLPSRTISQARQTAMQLKAELQNVLAGQSFSGDEPFLDGYTLDQYLQLPEAEKQRLWDKWATVDLLTLPERDVKYDAVFAR